MQSAADVWPHHPTTFLAPAAKSDSALIGSADYFYYYYYYYASTVTEIAAIVVKSNPLKKEREKEGVPRLCEGCHVIRSLVVSVS